MYPCHEQCVQRRSTELAVTLILLSPIFMLQWTTSVSCSMKVPSAGAFLSVASLPCCRLCMCVLSLRLPSCFLFLFCFLPLFVPIFTCNQCTLSPNCYCSLILTFKFATVSFIHHCQSNGMCFSCETSLSAASIMSAVKHWVTIGRLMLWLFINCSPQWSFNVWASGSCFH